MGVATEVVEDLFGTGEWPLRVDDPFGLAGWAEVLGEAPGFAEGLQSAGEAELSGLEGVEQRREEHPAEVAREGPGPGGRTRGGRRPSRCRRWRAPPPGMTQCRCG